MIRWVSPDEVCSDGYDQVGMIILYSHVALFCLLASA